MTLQFIIDTIQSVAIILVAIAGIRNTLRLRSK